jgi:hypothetical protein
MNLTDLNIPLIFYISFIMIVWFESDIVQTIANLTNTRNLLKINEFHKYKMEIDVMSSYPNFLHSMYPGYITKLISCPICLCFWSTLVGISSLLFVTNIPIIIGTLMFPINYITSLLLYLTARKLL